MFLLDQRNFLTLSIKDKASSKAYEQLTFITQSGKSNKNDKNIGITPRIADLIRKNNWAGHSVYSCFNSL